MTAGGPLDPAARQGAAAGPPRPARRKRRFGLDPRRDAWKILIVLGVLLIVDAGFTLFVLRPQSKVVQQLESEKANFDLTYRQARREAEAVQADYELAVERREEYDAFYEETLSSKLRRLGPVQAEILGIGEQFDTEPDPLNVNTKDLEEEGVQQLTLSFPLDGGYENLRRFIDAVERSEQLLIVDRISMTENRAEDGGLRLTIDVSTFFNAPYETRAGQDSRRNRGRSGRRSR